MPIICRYLFKSMYRAKRLLSLKRTSVYNNDMIKLPAAKRAIWRRIIVILVILILLFYAVIGNLIVSAALVPSFMRRLDAFEEITEESYSQMIYTDDITENTRLASAETKTWLAENPPNTETLVNEEGFRLVAAIFRQPDRQEHRWAVLLHGYTGWKEEMYHYAVHYWNHGYNILCPDMRCQGASEGDFIGMGYTDSYDNLLWLGVILKHDPDARIVLHGESMGASCALMMSGMEELPENVVCVVADCGYTDVRSIFRKQLKDWTSLPDIGITTASRLCLLARGGYDINRASALEAVGRSSVPTLIIHGMEDRFVPPVMSSRIYEACASEKELLQVPGAGHAQSSYKDPEKYYRTVFAFIESH